MPWEYWGFVIRPRTIISACSDEAVMTVCFERSSECLRAVILPSWPHEAKWVSFYHVLFQILQLTGYGNLFLTRNGDYGGAKIVGHICGSVALWILHIAETANLFFSLKALWSWLLYMAVPGEAPGHCWYGWGGKGTSWGVQGCAEPHEVVLQASLYQGLQDHLPAEQRKHKGDPCLCFSYKTTLLKPEPTIVNGTFHLQTQISCFSWKVSRPEDIACASSHEVAVHLLQSPLACSSPFWYLLELTVDFREEKSGLQGGRCPLLPDP